MWDVGERLSLPETERNGPGEARRQRPSTAQRPAARALKWRPWGRRVTAKLRNKRWQAARQRHLPASLPLPHAPAAARHRLPAEPGHGRPGCRPPSAPSRPPFSPAEPRGDESKRLAAEKQGKGKERPRRLSPSPAGYLIAAPSKF